MPLQIHDFSCHVDMADPIRDLQVRQSGAHAEHPWFPSRNSNQLYLFCCTDLNTDFLSCTQLFLLLSCVQNEYSSRELPFRPFTIQVQ